MAKKETSLLEPPTATLPAASQPATPMDLMAQALAEKADVTALRELMQLQRDWNADRAREAYIDAMNALQAELPVVAKERPVYDKNNKHMYDFAPLEDIKRKVDPKIRAHGFSYRFDVRMKDGQTYAVCVAQHKGGHSEESWFPMQPEKAPAMNNAQAVASGNSYAKRYAFINVFGIVCGGEDDDAANTEAPKEPPAILISRDDQKTIAALLEQLPEDKKQVFWNFVKVETLDLLTDAQAKKLIPQLRKQVKA